jgi:pimeloyl-ACP methyl ester carboxylesterase
LLQVIAMPKVRVNDIQIYYEVHGEGFPLVMIAGLSENLDFWDPRLVEELSRKFKLVMFDNRGAGRTDVSDRKYTIKLFADDTAGLMNALGISKAHVLGISMGGMIAQELVLNYPEKVAKLVLCSTCSGGSKDVQSSKEVSKMLTADTSKMSQEELWRMLLHLVLTDDFIEKNPNFVKQYVQRDLKHPISEEAYMRQLDAIRTSFNTYERLQQIKAPTLILHGKKDVLIPSENGAILAETIPNAKLVYFEKSAHILAEEMNEVINSLTDFLG